MNKYKCVTVIFKNGFAKSVTVPAETQIDLSCIESSAVISLMSADRDLFFKTEEIAGMVIDKYEE